MKFIKNFKLFETGEWTTGIDWDYIKDNPEDNSEEAAQIKYMEKKLNNIKYIIENTETLEKIHFEIIDIKGFDLYTGAYSIVKINNKQWHIYNSDYNNLWIEDFPIDNTSENGLNPGFDGNEIEVANAIIQHYDPTKKYNI